MTTSFFHFKVPAYGRKVNKNGKNKIKKNKPKRNQQKTMLVQSLTIFNL